jgi:hypothetical protein
MACALLAEPQHEAVGPQVEVARSVVKADPAAAVATEAQPGWLEPLGAVPSRRRRDKAQVLMFHTKAWSSFAPSTSPMPFGPYQEIPRADPGGRRTPGSDIA